VIKNIFRNKKLIRVIAVWGSGVLLFGILVFTFFVISVLADIPNLDLLQNRIVAESTKIYDRTGEVLLYEIHGEERRTIIPFEEIPEFVKQATISIEDANFYSHAALDWRGIARAFFTNLRRGGIVQGGSTITQQLAKKAFLSDERTPTRKLKELVLSFELEDRYSKDEILELYLNQIPYGSNAYGIESASQVFFEKPAKNLTLAEAAILVSLPRAPSYYSPWGLHTEDLFARQKLVLKQMRGGRFITEEEEQKALEEELVFAKPNIGIKAPHFVIAVQEYLNNTYGEDFVRTAGLEVITTLDWDLQQLGEEVVLKGAKRNEELYKGTNAALVAQDSNTGEILAMVGSRDYFDIEQDGNFNVAIQGLRQPGSALKPFVYATAFQKGYTPNTVIFDLETEFDATGISEKSYKPANYDNVFRGPITLRSALAQSINVPAVKVLYLAGLEDSLKNARAFGLKTLTEINRYGLSLVLGGGEVTLMDLVGAYSVFAEEGIKYEQSLILKITDDGKILEEHNPTGLEVIETETTRLINDVLSDVDARRPLFQNSLSLTMLPNQEIALKTGTTNDYRDAWTVGYTPSLVVGVWAGNNDNQPMERQGGSILAAVPIWHDFMIEAYEDKPTEFFTQPQNYFRDKPMINGEFLTTFQSGQELLPQIHSILFYIDRKNPLGEMPKNPASDSQFANWEAPVLQWITRNIPDTSRVNLPLAIDAVLVNTLNPTIPQNVDIAFKTPQNGDFITGTQLSLIIDITAQEKIEQIEVYFNGNNVQNIVSNFGNTFTFTTNFQPQNIQPQNLLKLKITDALKKTFEKEIILFTQS